MELPLISILTPIYDRKSFLELMLVNLESFSYDRFQMEWVICDSYSKDGIVGTPLLSKTELEEVKKRLSPIEVKYTYLKRQMSIGEKRNWLVKNSSANICINVDSDDIYVPEYLRYSVSLLKHHKKSCCGSPQMVFLFPSLGNKTTFLNCETFRQIHEATMCFTKKHFKRMGGFETRGYGEGAKMVDGCDEKYFIKSNIQSCMICICHDDNSVNKDKWAADEREVNIEMKHLERHMKAIEFIQSQNSPDLPSPQKIHDTIPETPL